MEEHIFYFRIELVGQGKTKEEAWEHALEGFAQDSGEAPELDSDLAKGPEGAPILGTPHTVDGGEVT